MNCGFSDILLGGRRRAFTFMEVVTALVIVSLITFGVLVVINRGVAAMIEGQARAQALEVARENMEKLLSSDTVSDMAEFGTHELNEDIQWETLVEAFDEPVKSDMWIRAVCSATYPGSDGELRTVELVHWLTDVSATQAKQIRDQRRREQEFLENMEGNPFGDDADGLTQYARALVNMGEYGKAAEALIDLLVEYPDAPQASMAVKKIVQIAYDAMKDGDVETAREIIDILKKTLPEDEDVQNLPDLDDVEPGHIPPISAWPANIAPKNIKPDSPTDGPNIDPEPDPDEPPPDDVPADQPTHYRGRKVPYGFYTWPKSEQDLWKKLVDWSIDG